MKRLITFCFDKFDLHVELAGMVENRQWRSDSRKARFWYNLAMILHAVDRSVRA